MPEPTSASRAARLGLACALGAYFWWGLAPTYFRSLHNVPAMVIMGHRIVWSAVLLALIVTLGRQWPDIASIARRRSIWPWLAASTSLVSFNWFVFIYSIETHRLVEASLGYFINPLVTVLLGVVFLGERLRPAQAAAGALAAAGVGYLTWAAGGLPWISLCLPISFGLYGLIRKKAPVGALPGLFIETLLVTPLAAAYLAWRHSRPEAAPYNDPPTLGLLSLAGIVTAVPMLWFVAAAQRLRLVTMGFLQYISPSMQLVIAVLAFGEPFGHERTAAFGLIWAAVALFVADSAAAARRPAAYD